MVNWKTVIFLVINLLLWLQFSVAQQLVVAYSNSNTEPYAFVQNGELTDGVIKRIADELGSELDLPIYYRNIPKRRIPMSLLSGEIQVHIISNPLWIQDAKKLQWSIPLFKESNVFVVSSSNDFPISCIKDLQGKRVGTVLGYYYSGLMDAFKNGTIIRDDSSSLEKNFERLKMGRIDCLIDSNILIKYYLESQHAQDQFVVSSFTASTQNIEAAFSPDLPIPFVKINSVLKCMVDTGKIQNILNNYK